MNHTHQAKKESIHWLQDWSEFLIYELLAVECYFYLLYLNIGFCVIKANQPGANTI